jgi:basic amino acid/polyamine antiporter, APA family
MIRIFLELGMNPRKKISLFSLICLVAGNMIASAIFMLPASLARIGSVSIASWILTVIGALFLALVFSKMSFLFPKTGGPYVYAEKGFGRFIGFQTAYNYWIAVLLGNVSLAIGFVGYLQLFFPLLAKPEIGAIAACVAIFVLTLVNIRGVHFTSLFQMVTTVLKLIPLFAIGIFGWFYFHPQYLIESFNVSGRSNFSAVSYAATLTLWAFVGIESATIPADDVLDPKKNIPLATIIGTLLVAVVYVVTSVVAMGIIPAKDLANSTFPFSLVAQLLFGKWGSYFVAIGAIISCLSALAGWILIQGQVSIAPAKDKMFPKCFAKENKYGAPVWSLVITSSLACILILLTAHLGLIEQFQLTILVASVASLVAYFYTALAEIVVLIKQGESAKSIINKEKINIVIAFLAALYSFWAMFGSGKDIVFYVMMMVFSSVPMYLFTVRKQEKAD